MKKWIEYMLLLVFAIGGILGGIFLQDAFGNQPEEVFGTMILLWIVLIPTLYTQLVSSIKRRSLSSELAIAKRKEQDWQSERALYTILEDKLHKIFVICHTPTPQSTPDGREYPRFRDQLLTSNGGRRGMQRLLSLRMMPNLPATGAAPELTDDQQLRLLRFVRGATPESVR